MQTSVPEYSLFDFVRIAFSRWKLILAITVAFLIGGVIYSKTLADIYKSQTIVMHSDGKGSGGLAGIAGQLGGLAGLAGINIGAAGDDSAVYLEILKSRQFTVNFVKHYHYEKEVVAANGWDKNANSLTFDSRIFDVEQDKWHGASLGPSDETIYQTFKSQLSISKDRETGLITIGYEHYSPSFAEMCLRNLIQYLNTVIRERDIDEADKSMFYLSKQAEQTNVTEIKATLYKLIEEQVKTKMFAEVRDNYAFKTIDPPIVPEKKAKPRRMAIIASFFLIGFVLSVLFNLVFYFARNEKKFVRG